MYSDVWVFNAAAFQLVLPEMIVFFKFRNAIVSQTKFDRQKIIMLIDDVSVSLTGVNTVEIKPKSTQDVS